MGGDDGVGGEGGVGFTHYVDVLAKYEQVKKKKDTEIDNYSCWV